MQLTVESIRYAVDRLKNFESVHRGEDLSNKIEALDVMMESLGMDDKIKSMLVEWLNRFEDGEGYEGQFLLGVVVGTFACRQIVENK